MNKVVIASAVRTPIGSFGGSLSSLTAVDLGVVAAKEAIKRAGIKPEDVDHTIIGCVFQHGLKQGMARQISIGSGIPVESPAFTINILCGSGLRSIELAASEIRLGESDIILAGGSESMSNIPYTLSEARWGARMSDKKLVDSMLNDGLLDPFINQHMGVTAENVAAKYNISRKEQDEFALLSQKKATSARDQGRFKDEMVAVEVVDRKKNVTVVDTDQDIREDASMDSLSKLKTVFKKDGTVTAGSSSGINDGASMLILMSEKKARELNIKPLASIVSYATAGVEPEIMGTGPIPATKKALEKASLTIDDIDLVECNEAFAAQSIAVQRELNIDMEKLNVNGGAIALGHPVGCSGARILTTLLYEMQRRNLKKGLATLCIGGGMGSSLIVER